MAVGGGTPPLRLKDLLELDCDSCSAGGFRCYPRRLGSESSSSLSPMRHLLESSSSLRRRRPGKLSHLSRSLSRRLRGGFWRRRDEDATAAAVSSGSEAETSSESSDNSSERSRSRALSSSYSDFSSASSASESMHAAVLTAAGDDHEAMKRGPMEEGSEVDDDKEQLSPVAVMDFPFDDYGKDEEGDGGDGEERVDEAGACSPSRDDNLAGLQGKKTHKIRRFGSLDDLVPMDIEARLAATSDPDDGLDGDEVPAQQQLERRTDAATPPRASSDHGGADVHGEPGEHGLLALFMDTVSPGVDDVSERLLLDFFVEMEVKRRSEHAGLPAPAGVRPRKAERLGDGAVLAAARGWLDGGEETGRWGLKDVLVGCGVVVVAEMERGRRWMQVGEEEREVGAVVAGLVVDQLVDEVVRDLIVQVWM